MKLFSTKSLILALIAAIILILGFKGFEYFENQKTETIVEKVAAEDPVETKIINEIKTNEPAKTNEPDKTTTTTTSSPNQELIELYYNRLAQGDLDEAYAMKKYKTMDLSVFKGWYKNLKATEFLDFITVAPNQYDFIVELENDDGSKEKFRIVMQVEGKLLNTISSTSTDESPALRFVYGEDGDVTTLFLVTKGNKKIIDTAKKSKYEEFNNVEISYGGDYLMYFKTGAESNEGKIYDIATNKVIHDIGPTRGLYGFTYDLKHFYNCIESGMHGGEIKSYSVPGFKLEKDLANESMVIKCDSYDKKSNTLRYTLGLNGFENQHSYVYEFATGSVNK